MNKTFLITCRIFISNFPRLTLQTLFNYSVRGEKLPQTAKKTGKSATRKIGVDYDESSVAVRLNIESALCN